MGVLLLRACAWLVLSLAAVAWLAVAITTLVHAPGWPGALLILALAALLRLTWPLQIAVLLGLSLLWHWPWPLALLAAAPRLLLILPGLISWWIARRRHPAPLWPPYGQHSP